MTNYLKTWGRYILAFVCDQYIVLLFILTTGLKFAFMYDKAIGLDWYGDKFSYGFWMSFVATLLLFSPLFLIRKHKEKIAIVLALLLSILALIDTVYYSYFSSLPTAGLISSVGQASDVGPAILDLLKWWMLLYFVDIALVIIFRKQLAIYIDKIRLKLKLKPSNIKASLIGFVIVILFFVQQILIPGADRFGAVINRGFDTMSTANQYGIIVAHGIDLARFVIQSTTNLSENEKSALINWVKENKPPQSISDLNGTAKGKNVILLQVESLGGFVINQQFNGKEITPNLNKLSSESQFFPNERFLLGAGHTSDTDFVSNTSYFPISDSATFVRYGRDNFTSLPKILANDGYSTYAFHGFNRNFWNRNEALKSLGYQKFFAADNFPKGRIINMGLNDEDFLMKTAEYIKQQPKPSLSYVITLTSHTPFNVTGRTDLNIDTNQYPQQVGGYIDNINYVDSMIGKFFDKLKTDGLYDDSLIIIYGDHTPVLDKFSIGSINYDPESRQSKEVPLIVKLPADTKVAPKVYPNYGNHTDITPTVLDLLGIKTNQLVFGQSLFSKENSDFIQCDNQIMIFKKLGNCKTGLESEKTQSSTIIRYNQFNNINNI